MIRRALALGCLAVAVACGSLRTADDETPGDEIDDAGRERVGADASPPTPTNDAAEACTASCAGRSCGLVCDASCGTCAAAEVCDTNETSATCKAPTIVWEVDGTRVVAYASAEAFYAPSAGSTTIFFPYFGRNVSITVPSDATAGPLTSCPSNAVVVTLMTSDNAWAGLDALPARWRGLVFTLCGASTGGDVVTARDVTLTHVSPARIAGHYEILVQGKGAREGSTLRVRGVFDLVPTVQ